MAINKVFTDECDKMIHSLLQDKIILNSFINHSIESGDSEEVINERLEYFGINKLK